METTIFEQIKQAEDRMIALRRVIHENPELSGFEKQTLALIREELTGLGLPFTEHPFGGILAFIENGDSERTVLLRADMDALPVTESARNLIREKEVISKKAEASHICGHDAHTAMLLTAAKILNNNRSRINGRVILCFERAEENGGPGTKYGAQAFAPYFAQENTRIDSCFAIHVNPQISAGLVSVNEGGVMAGNTGYDVTLTGRGGHGARPDEANNPLDCFIAIYRALTEFRLRQVSPFKPMTVAVPAVHTGSQGNLIEDTLTFSGTARFFNEEVGELFRGELLRSLEQITPLYRCTYTVDMPIIYSVVKNDTESSRVAREAIKKYAGEKRLTSAEPLMVSEPYSLYLKKYPGVMAFLGIRNEAYGSGADLHNARFDIDESVLKYGVAAHVGYALESLS